MQLKFFIVEKIIYRLPVWQMVRLLDFIHVTDLCSIFGNALDNAIEHVIMIPEAEKRLIHLTVSAKKSFVFIKIEKLL